MTEGRWNWHLDRFYEEIMKHFRRPYGPSLRLHIPFVDLLFDGSTGRGSTYRRYQNYAQFFLPTTPIHRISAILSSINAFDSL